MKTVDDLLLTRKQLAEKLQCSQALIVAAQKRGGMPYRKIGPRSIRYPWALVVDWINEGEPIKIIDPERDAEFSARCEEMLELVAKARIAPGDDPIPVGVIADAV